MTGQIFSNLKCCLHFKTLSFIYQRIVLALQFSFKIPSCFTVVGGVAAITRILIDSIRPHKGWEEVRIFK